MSKGLLPKWLILATVMIMAATGVAFAYDNLDACPSCAWSSFYENNGYKFIKVHPNGTVSGSFETAFQNAANGWNGKLKVLRWLWDPSGPASRSVYSYISDYELGKATRTGSPTITACDAGLNSYALTRTGQTSQALKDYAALHELGHCWGLGHSTVNPAAMRYGTVTEDETIGSTPQTDDMNGIKAHYSFEN